MPTMVMSHQIDILPYPGFWHRVATSDIADLGGLYDWWNKGSDYYHHRVKIGWDDNKKWLTLPIEAHTGYRQIDVKIKNELLPRCYDELEKMYGKCKNWSLYSDYLKYTFCECKYDKMWELNFKLLLWIRDTLKIDTPICISFDTGTEGDATDKIASQLKYYDADTYYCGKGGKEYLDVSKLKDTTGMDVKWVEYKAPVGYSTVSIISMMMDFSVDKIIEMIK